MTSMATSTTQAFTPKLTHGFDQPVARQPMPEPPAHMPHPPLTELPGQNASPLNDEHLQQLAAAKIRAKRVNFAASIAAINGWSIGAFAALTLLGAIFSVSALPLAIGMGIVAWIEITGSARLRRFDTKAPRRLGFNQLGFAALLVAYAVWQLVAGLTGPSRYAEYMDYGSEVAGMLGPIEDITRVITIVVYVSVIVFALLVPGLTARYYFTRAKHIYKYLKHTPDWVVQMQRAQGSI